MRCVDVSIGKVITVTENSNSGMEEEEEICRGKDGVEESSGGLEEEEVIYIRTFPLVAVGNGKLEEENSA